MKFLNNKNVLCIGAHPDDIEYGMSGTFQKCWNTNFTVVVMSSGGDFDKTSSVNRNKENISIWDCFDNVDGFFGSGFVKEQAEDAMVNFIETTIMDKSITAIVTTPQFDSHFEHRKINNLGPALCRRSPITLIEYRTPSTLNHWIPNYFINLNQADYNKKKDVLKLFKSQQKAPYFNSKTIDSFHHNFLCSKKGLDLVESYRIVESFQI